MAVVVVRFHGCASHSVRLLCVSHIPSGRSQCVLVSAVSVGSCFLVAVLASFNVVGCVEFVFSDVERSLWDSLWCGFAFAFW